MSTLIEANTAFCVDLFKELAKKNPNKNVFLSPLSISVAFCMVHFGARGDSAKQIEKALHFSKITGSGSSSSIAGDQCDQPGGLHSLLKELLAATNQHTKNYALSIASRLYGAERYAFHQRYLRCTKELYGAELERVDFQRATEEVRKKINSWVESQTNDKIKNLFSPGSIDASTALVLNQSKNVQMMHQNGVFNWAEIQTPKIEILELLYDQGDLSMLILLPHGKGGLDQVQEELTYAKFKEWTRPSGMKKRELGVYLPKFKLQEQYGLSDALQALGMKDVFNAEKADLTGMSESGDLFITSVVHKAYVEVNEEGTEAAAATGAAVGTTSAKPAFMADRRFLFAIRQNKTQSILFVGTIRTP